MSASSTETNRYLSLYVGTYGNKMYAFRFNPDTLECCKTGEAGILNSSYIALTAQHIYAISESGEQSAVSAFRIHPGPEETSVFEHINTRTDIGLNPCYITFYNGHLFTADYTGGSVSVFPVNPQTGALEPASQTVAYPGLSPEELALRNPATAKRQQSAHIHTVRVVPEKNIETVHCGQPGNQYFLATDLGCDQIRLFKIFSQGESGGPSGKPPVLVPNTPASVQMPAGSGPRHIAFGIDNHCLYVLNELSGKVLVYQLSEQDNNLQLSPVQEIVSDPTGAQACGDIKIHPSGKFLYTTNRRQNDGVAVYRIAATAGGRLEQTGYIHTAKHPRNIAITPAGDFLFVAGKDERKIEIYTIHPETGSLAHTGKEIVFAQEEPVCMEFRP